MSFSPGYNVTVAVVQGAFFTSETYTSLWAPISSARAVNDQGPPLTGANSTASQRFGATGTPSGGSSVSAQRSAPRYLMREGVESTSRAAASAASSPSPSAQSSGSCGRGSGGTFASTAGSDSNCAVCWDDLVEPRVTEEAPVEADVEEGRGVGGVETAAGGPSEESSEIIGSSTAVRIPGCGHTLCAECTYSWLKANITSGKLSGNAMRCPLASVPVSSGGHGMGDGRGRSTREEARELSPKEVESLIFTTASVGAHIEAEAEAAAARAKTAADAKVKKEGEAKILKALDDAIANADDGLRFAKARVCCVQVISLHCCSSAIAAS